MNTIVLTGIISKDGCIRYTRENRPVGCAGFVFRKRANKEPIWFDLAAFGEHADDVAVLRKGDLVSVSGAFDQDTYKDRNGIERMKNEIEVDRIELIKPSRVDNGKRDQIIEIIKADPPGPPDRK